MSIQALADFANVETSFSHLYQRYEKMKTVMDNFKKVGFGFGIEITQTRLVGLINYFQRLREYEVSVLIDTDLMM